MYLIAVLRKHQGDRSLREYAEFLGIGASTLSQVYSGLRRAGNDVHDAFLTRYPDAANEYVQAQMADANQKAQVVEPEAVAV